MGFTPGVGQHRWHAQPGSRAKSPANLGLSLAFDNPVGPEACAQDLRKRHAGRAISGCLQSRWLERPPEHLEDGLHRDLATGRHGLSVSGPELWPGEVGIRVPQWMSDDLNLVSTPSGLESTECDRLPARHRGEVWACCSRVEALPVGTEKSIGALVERQARQI